MKVYFGLLSFSSLDQDVTLQKTYQTKVLKLIIGQTKRMSDALNSVLEKIYKRRMKFYLMNLLS